MSLSLFTKVSDNKYGGAVTEAGSQFVESLSKLSPKRRKNMSNKPDIDNLDLSDAELLKLIKNHGIDRRSVMKVLGAGTALSLGAGGAVAKHDQPHTPHIDSHYGYATPDADDIPKKLEPDREVELHVIPPNPPNQPPMFHFAPSGLAADPAAIVQFTFTFPDHTVTAYHPEHGFQQRVPDDVPPFSSPIINVGGAWLYQFNKKGLYDMYCGPHHILGMAMRIIVGEDVTNGDVPGFAGPEQTSPPFPFSKLALEHELNNWTAFIEEEDNKKCEWVWLTPKEILDADALDPGNIQDDGTVSFDEVLHDIDRVPDDVHHGHE